MNNLKFSLMVIIGAVIGFYLYANEHDVQKLSLEAAMATTVSDTGQTDEASQDTSGDEKNPAKFDSQDFDSQDNDKLAAKNSKSVTPAAQPMAETKNQSEQDFSRLLQKTLSSLPTLQAFKNLSNEDVHHAPQIILDAGTALGRITDRLHQNPELTAQGLNFYKSCFSREDLPVQIRALCLAEHRNLRNFSLESGTVSKNEISNFEQAELMAPTRVVALSLEVPNRW